MLNKVDDLIQDLSDAEFVQRPQGQVAYASEVAFKAKDELIAMGLEVVPAVVKCLVGPGPRHQRAMAAQVLGEIGSEDAVSALVNKLRDSEIVVRGFSAEALGKIGDKRAIAPLLELLKKDKEDDTVIAYVKGALNRLGYVEKRADKIKLWKQVYWLGVLIMLPGILTVILVLFTWSNTNVAESNWLGVFGFVGISIALGSSLVYLANRPVQSEELEKRLHKTKFWRIIFGMGLLVLIAGLLIGIAAPFSSELNADGSAWYFVLICGVPPIVLGSLALFLATRPFQKKDEEKTA